MKARRIDMLSLFTGILCIVAGVAFLLDQHGTINLDATVFAPVALIVIGLGAALNARRDD